MEVISATVDIDQVTTYRAAVVSRSYQAATINEVYPSVYLNKNLFCTKSQLSQNIAVSLLSPSEEIRYGPACWLWDYLRRSNQGGFFLPLSGGIDSCSTALIVYSMCEMVFEKIRKGGILF